MSVVAGPRSRTDRRRPSHPRRVHRRHNAEVVRRHSVRRAGADGTPTGIASGRFALIVTLLLGLGLIGALVVNTSLAGGAIALTDAESKLARATERLEALEVSTDALSSPGALQSQALALGLVPAPNPVFLDPATGAISGALNPAVPPEEPLVQGSQLAVPEPGDPVAAGVPTPGLAGTASAGPRAPVAEEDLAPVEQDPEPSRTGLDGATVVPSEVNDDQN